MVGAMKLYISRDEDSDDIWLWLQPKKGNWKPSNVCGKEFVNYQREAMNEIDKYCCYDKKDFKKKFGQLINKKTCKCVHLPDKLVLDNVDAKYGLFFG
jgi:hypothetical protein